MMNWVFMYIRKLSRFMYYSYYVFFEGIFHTSKSWPTINSITALMSLNIGLPFYLCYGKFFGDNKLVMCLIIIILYQLIKCYYRPMHKSIEANYRRDSILKKILYGSVVPIICWMSLRITVLLGKT